MTLFETAAPPRRRFVHEEHRYFVGDRELVSVTRVLHLAGLIDDRWYTEFGRQRGSAVHQALERMDTEGLEDYDVDPRLEPYIAAYRDFCTEASARWEFVEARFWHEVRGFAGTVDRVGYLGDELACVDFKTGQPEFWHRVQLAAYTQLIGECCDAYGRAPRISRYGLYLTSDGRYSLIPYRDRTDAAVFQAALTVAQFKVVHGAHTRTDDAGR